MKEMQDLRIAMLSTCAWRTPPERYGPWERVASLLTEGLIKRGVNVTLFATGDSATAGTLKSVCPVGYRTDQNMDETVWKLLHSAEVFEHADQFDIIHNHFDYPPLTYSRLVRRPLLTTIHGFSSPKILPVYQKYNNNTHYVSISNANRHPSLKYVATVYNGIDIENFPFKNEMGEYLVFFGRIDHQKGALEAIQAAQKAGERLVIAGLIADQEYFKKRIEPYIDNNGVTYAGNVGPDERNRLLSSAKALLHLINFDEPFGLSVVESLACGTPVIATERGSMPEIIADGQTGFLVNNVDEAVAAIGRLPEINRAACRASVEQKFTVERMVDGYLAAYEKILSSSPTRVQG